VPGELPAGLSKGPRLKPPDRRRSPR
jgi:hypothetical protein